MKFNLLLSAILFVVACVPNLLLTSHSCYAQGNNPHLVLSFDPNNKQTLADARKDFKTKIIVKHQPEAPADKPSPKIAKLVKYKSPVGELSAYVTTPANTSLKYPAIIWITGGDFSTISADIMDETEPENDQSAGSYRKARIITMYPSLRGGNDNPGERESFYGEVDDIIAAYDYLVTLPYIDKERIYLGGHSTGGTLVLLASEITDKFRAIFSFGPISNVAGYEERYNFYDLKNKREVELRCPILWMHSIKSPSYVFEGAQEPGNIGELNSMKKLNKNPQLHFITVQKANHFDILRPLNDYLAKAINREKVSGKELIIDEKEINSIFGK